MIKINFAMHVSHAAIFAQSVVPEGWKFSGRQSGSISIGHSERGGEPRDRRRSMAGKLAHRMEFFLFSSMNAEKVRKCLVRSILLLFSLRVGTFREIWEEIVLPLPRHLSCQNLTILALLRPSCMVLENFFKAFP